MLTMSLDITIKERKELRCPDCGVREALCSIGVEEAEREEILGIIHRVGREKRCK